MIEIKKPANWKTAAEAREINKQTEEELFEKILIRIMDEITETVKTSNHSIFIDVTPYSVSFVTELHKLLVREGGYKVKVSYYTEYGNEDVMEISW